MADEPIQDDHPEIPPASVPKPEREPVTIKGEAVDLTPPVEETEPPEPELTEPEPIHLEAEPPPPPSGPSEPYREPAPKPSNMAAFVAGAVGVLIGAAVVYAAVGLTGPSSSELQAATTRLDTLETGLSSETTARKALDGRIAALEGRPSVNPDALAAATAEAKTAAANADKAMKAVGDLGAKAGAGASNAGPNPALQKIIGDEQALADRVARLEAAESSASKASGGDPALADRLSRLESAQKEAAPIDPEFAKLPGEEKTLEQRIGKLEAALAAPKMETRAEPDVGMKGDPIAEGFAALALDRRLVAGQPYPTELAALEKLGAPPDALAALKPYATTGAPTLDALGAGFAKLAPGLVEPGKAPVHTDYAGTLWDEMKGLVKVHPVGEAKGDDPEAVKTQVVAALARGDLRRPRRLRETAGGRAHGGGRLGEGRRGRGGGARRGPFSHRDVAFAPHGAKKIV